MLSPPVLVGMAIFCPLKRVPLTMIETICSEPFSATSMVRSRFPEGYGRRNRIEQHVLTVTFTGNICPAVPTDSLFLWHRECVFYKIVTTGTSSFRQISCNFGTGNTHGDASTYYGLS